MLERQHAFTISVQNMHCLRVEISIILQSKHSKHSLLEQFDVEFTVFVSTYHLNGKAFCSVFVCLAKKPSNEAKT